MSKRELDKAEQELWSYFVHALCHADVCLPERHLMADKLLARSRACYCPERDRFQMALEKVRNLCQDALS